MTASVAFPHAAYSFSKKSYYGKIIMDLIMSSETKNRRAVLHKAILVQTVNEVLAIANHCWYHPIEFILHKGKKIQVNKKVM